MSFKPPPIISNFIWLEAILGIVGGIVFISISPENATDTLNNSIFKFFLSLNAIFFGVTIVLGTINLILIKKISELPLSVLASVGIGIVSIVVSAFASSTFGIVAAFIPLGGFIFGFYLPVLNKFYKET